MSSVPSDRARTEHFFDGPLRGRARYALVLFLAFAGAAEIVYAIENSGGLTAVGEIALGVAFLIAAALCLREGFRQSA